jgi:hypothetical protein
MERDRKILSEEESKKLLWNIFWNIEEDSDEIANILKSVCDLKITD